MSGPPRCDHSMLMSWGPLSVGAAQPELEECLNHAWTCSSLRRKGGECVWSLVMGGALFSIWSFPGQHLKWLLSFTSQAGKKLRVATNPYVLCPGQDIILYCKFIKETLQYRWCTIQGFIPPPAPSVHTQEGPRWLLSAGEGRQTVTITEFQ